MSFSSFLSNIVKTSYYPILRVLYRIKLRSNAFEVSEMDKEFLSGKDSRVQCDAEETCQNSDKGKILVLSDAIFTFRVLFLWVCNSRFTFFFQKIFLLNLLYNKIFSIKIKKMIDWSFESGFEKLTLKLSIYDKYLNIPYINDHFLIILSFSFLVKIIFILSCN